MAVHELTTNAGKHGEGSKGLSPGKRRVLPEKLQPAILMRFEQKAEDEATRAFLEFLGHVSTEQSAVSALGRPGVAP